ncbi:MULTISPECIES: restriction endonuclease subunit S [Chryseobacterium]|uniref:Type I restriction enzyme, S subunit n=1 Tax=Chryseobacterium profundimaris TaxID=1387275 RepID=A0ABY1NL92_9FLAO|nr:MULTISPECIES: restriction endonuclease subunit S [Chryseobacterium]SMP12422.1 type I restriction enzyme, S subunit [Chryseobacterium profundimaris]
MNTTFYSSIPESWKVSKLKYVANIFSGNSLNDLEKEKFSNESLEKSNGRVYISSKDINVSTNKCNYDTGLVIPVEELKYKVAPKHTSLMCIEGGSAGRKLTFTNQEVCFVNKLACFCGENEEISKYLYFYLQSVEFKMQFNSALSGLIGGVSLTNLNDFEVPAPPMLTQIRITKFLYQKTAEIDTIIEKKEKILILLEEKKKAIINEVVTKGLNPDAPMKDSGIEWIGEIPKHWEVKPLGFLGYCQNGVSKGGEYFGKGLPFVNYGDIYKNYELPKVVEGLADSTEDDRLAYSVEKGDVFFTRTSETIEEIGIASTCLETIENAVFSGFTIRFRPNDLNQLLPAFSKFFFRSDYVRVSLVKEMNLVTRASLSQSLLKSLKIILPPPKDQEQIAIHLENQFLQFEKLKCGIVSQIEKLKEYRQSLISEAVTGKIEI